MSLFYLVVIIAIIGFVVIGIPTYFVRRAARSRREKNPENIP